MKLSVLGLALGAALGLSSCTSKQEKAPMEAAAVVRGAKIEVVQVHSVPEEYQAIGTVRAKSAATLSSKAVGTVVSLRVGEGDRVKAGQVVAEIDDRGMQAQAEKADAGSREAQEALAEVDAALRAAEQAIAAARANRDLASATYARIQALADRGSASRQELDEAEARSRSAEAEATRAADTRDALAAKRRQVLARMDQAKADVSGARTALTYSRILSPVTGVVSAKHAEVGTLAAPGVPLVTIEDDSVYRLEVAVEEEQLSAVRLGQSVRARIDAMGDKELSGRVEEIVPTGDPASRSFLVKVGLGREKGLYTGLFGRAMFQTGVRKVTAVPRRALVERGQLAAVFALDGGNVARLRLVTTGRSFGDAVEVLSGLTAGERIVTEGADRVADGGRVE